VYYRALNYTSSSPVDSGIGTPSAIVIVEYVRSLCRHVVFCSDSALHMSRLLVVRFILHWPSLAVNLANHV
jgi:hypothetical protein